MSCISAPTETGSRAASLWSNRPWPRSWRPTLPCTCCVRGSAKPYSSTAVNLRSPTFPVRTTGSCSPTRSSGKYSPISYKILQGQPRQCTREDPPGAAVLQQWAQGTVPVQSELQGVVLKPDHLVNIPLSRSWRPTPPCTSCVTGSNLISVQYKIPYFVIYNIKCFL